MAEQLVIKAADKDLMTITLRPHLIWGPKDNHLVPRIIERAGRLVRVGSGKNLVDTIYIDNAAEAHVLAADRLKENPGLSGKVYFISQDNPVPLWDMVNDILKTAGHPPVKRAIPRKIAWLMGALFEVVFKMFRIRGEPQMTRFLADELATAHWFDIRAAKKDLGYAPTVSIKEGLSRLEQWLQNRY
jgi:nucleoside-diphosphate-sugar epimerase